MSTTMETWLKIWMEFDSKFMYNRCTCGQKCSKKFTHHTLQQLITAKETNNEILLHNSCFGNASLEGIQVLIEIYSDVIQSVGRNSALSLNYTNQNNTCLEVNQGIVVSDSDASKAHDENCSRKRHLPCQCCARFEMFKMLAET